MPKAKKKTLQRELPVARKNPKRKDPTTGGPETQSMAKEILATALKEYSKNANKEKAIQMKRYMRDQYEFFGIQTPLRKELDKKVSFDIIIF